MRIDRPGDQRDRAWRDRHPTTVLRLDRLAAPPRHVAGGLSARVRDLDRRHRPALGDDGGQTRQTRLVLRVPGAEAARGDTADRLDRRRLGHHDAGATGGPRAQMLDVPVGAHAILGAVLAHGGDHDAVFRGDGAEGDRFEQQRRRHRGVILR